MTDNKFSPEVLRLLKKHGIEIESEPALAEALDKIDINKKLPQEMLNVIREIVLQINSVKDRWVSDK